MPPALAAIHKSLWNDLAWVYGEWFEYQRVFIDTENAATISKSAANFFAMVKDAIVLDVLLGISRLTDSAKMGKRENMSIGQLLVSTSIAEMPALDATVQQLHADALQKSAFARDLRNRILAHRDLPTAAGQHPDPLPDHTDVAQITTALDAIAALLNAVDNHFGEGWTPFGELSGFSDRERLLRQLRIGQAKEEEERERFGL